MRTTTGAGGSSSAPQLCLRRRSGTAAEHLRCRRNGCPVDPGTPRRLMLAAVPRGTLLWPVGRAEHKRSDPPHAQPHVGDQLGYLHQHAPLRRETLCGQKQNASLRRSLGAVLVRLLRDVRRHARPDASPINDNFNIMPMFDKNHNLTVYGWVSSVFGTWVGAILLVAGVLWETRVLKKLKVAFRSARSAGVQ